MSCKIIKFPARRWDSDSGNELLSTRDAALSGIIDLCCNDSEAYFALRDYCLSGYPEIRGEIRRTLEELGLIGPHGIPDVVRETIISIIEDDDTLAL